MYISPNTCYLRQDIKDYTPFEIIIDDISIEIVYVFNILCLIMDERINWKSR